MRRWSPEMARHVNEQQCQRARYQPGHHCGYIPAAVEPVRAALARQVPPHDPVELLTEFGGYEIAMLTGAILAAATRR